MSELLSQQEIDLLMHSGGERVPEHIQENDPIPFDFRLPNRISKNQLRTIRNIHENFAESLSSFLVTKLQTIVNIKVTTVDQIYYSEYILSVPNPACLYTFHIKGTDIKGILELNSDLAFTLVDRLLGGNGLGTKQTKIITPIEQKVLSVIIDRVSLDLKKTWQIIDQMDFVFEKFEPDIDFVQLTSTNESVLLISFELTFGDKTYLMNLCFATFAFDPILEKMSSKKMSSIRPSKRQGTSAQEIITRQLYQTQMPIKVELGHSEITMEDLLNLNVGDVIILKNKIHEEHAVKINDKIFFYGRQGSVNNHKAVKITRNLFPSNII